MPGKYLLDTSILIALIRGDSTVGDHVATADAVYTSVVAVGELRFGVLRAERPREAEARVDALVADLTILGCDPRTAVTYARLKDELRRRGRPIPDNDLWIAATSAQHGLVLAFRDRHFHALESVSREAW